MAIGVGISGPRGGGGGTPSIADPSSFADAYGLWRSDVGLTIVDERVDKWEDQSGNGFHVQANGSANRPMISNLEGAYGFADLMNSSLNDQFRASGLNSSTEYEEFTLDLLFRTMYTWQGYYPCPANVNANNYPILLAISNTTITVTCYGNTGKIRFTCPQSTSSGIATRRLTVVMKLTEASPTNRIKIYIDGVKQVTTYALVGAGTAPTTSRNHYGQFNMSSSATSSKMHAFQQYAAIWERALSPDEIVENNNWKNEICII